MYINVYFPRRINEYFHQKEVINASHQLSEVDYNFYMDDKLFQIASYIRKHLNEPIRINSAYRTNNYNISVGGSPRSQHKLGKALDLSSKNIVSFMLESYNSKNTHFQNMRKLGLNGLGFYDTFIHIDTREGVFSTWNNQTKKKLQS